MFFDRCIKNTIDLFQLRVRDLDRTNTTLIPFRDSIRFYIRLAIQPRTGRTLHESVFHRTRKDSSEFFFGDFDLNGRGTFGFFFDSCNSNLILVQIYGKNFDLLPFAKQMQVQNKIPSIRRRTTWILSCILRNERSIRIKNDKTKNERYKKDRSSSKRRSSHHANLAAGFNVSYHRSNGIQLFAVGILKFLNAMERPVRKKRFEVRKDGRVETASSCESSPLLDPRA